MLFTKDCAEAGHCETTQVCGVPKAPRQQNWSVLYLVQGLRQDPPLRRSALQFVRGASLHRLGDTQLPLDTVSPMGLSKPST
jgi:hypothetical protein